MAGVEFFDNKFFGLSNMEAGSHFEVFFFPGGGKVDLSNSLPCRPIRSDPVERFIRFSQILAQRNLSHFVSVSNLPNSPPPFWLIDFSFQAGGMDPQQRHVLETSYEALFNAGTWRGSVVSFQSPWYLQIVYNICMTWFSQCGWITWLTSVYGPRYPHGRLSEEFFAAAIHCGLHRRHQPRVYVGAPELSSKIRFCIHPIHLQMDRSAEMHDHEKIAVKFFKLKNLEQSSRIFNEAFNKVQDVQRCLSIAFRCLERRPFFGVQPCAEIRPQRSGCPQWHRSFTRRDAEFNFWTFLIQKMESICWFVIGPWTSCDQPAP